MAPIPPKSTTQFVPLGISLLPYRFEATFMNESAEKSDVDSLGGCTEKTLLVFTKRVR